MSYRRIVFLLLLVAGLVALSTLDVVHQTAARGLEVSSNVIREHEALGLFLFAALSAASAILFFFSTAMIVPVAITAWGRNGTMLLLWCSWMVGATISYWIGKRPGRRLARWMVPEEEVRKYEQKIAAKATFPLVLLFQIAVPSEIPGLVLGALRYPFVRYFAARAIAELPFAIGVVYLGDTFIRRQYLPLAGIAVAGILLSATALYLLHKRMET